ncbi:MAG: TonB-dependent receptor [Dysgonamonadaceae bacterium]|jgi:hypothetical protein|nr:TonB-dependent receptor [Dysgonamonadaceae bacterium]
MKKTIISFAFFCLTFLSLSVKAQSPEFSVQDTVPIESLLKKIESSTAYRIYSDLPPSYGVAANQDISSPVLSLEKIVEDTPYKVSVYGNKIFILRDKKLINDLAIFSAGKEHLPGSGENEISIQPQGVETATSENLVYAVGDRYAKKTPQTVELKGKITDSKTRDPLPGISLVLKEPYAGSTTDANGDFTLKLPVGQLQLDITGLNIKPSRRQLILYGDGVLNIELVEDIHQLGEVVVTASAVDNVKRVNIGVEKLQLAKIKNIPMALGEVDILRAIQTLPGVKTVGEASTGFNVRGGSTDQNLILLNDGTIYNPNHLFGFFTAFSSDMVKDAEIYKSSIPAQYGGRISSVLDVTGKEADKEEFKGSAGIGLVTGKLNLEIPVVKKKSSVLLSGRTTYSDWILKNLPSKSDYKDGSAGFYDLGMVLSNDLDTRNQLNVYGYFSHDRFSFTENDKYSYRNMNVSAKWKRIFSDKLLSSFGAGYDHYDYKTMDKTDPSTAYNLSFGIDQVFAKADFSYILENHKIDFGLKSLSYTINGGTYKPEGDESLVKQDEIQKEKALESALYIGDQWDLTPRFSINAGIRFSMFNALGPRTYYKYNPGLLPYESTITDTVTVNGNKPVKTYLGPEFRLSARYLIGENLSVKAGFNSMRQYIHKLSNTVIMSPTDTWKLSDANIKPQKGWQAATGLYYNFGGKEWESSLEVYYKKMNDYLDYRSGARLLMNHHIETDVINTEGRAYGLELSLRKTVGKLNGWAGYTYSRTFLRQSDKMIINPVNGGDWYPADYDKPHDFKLAGNYKFTQRFSLSLNLDYSTGRPTTIPAGKYFNRTLNSTQVFYTDRNSYRIPDYFRMDASFNVEPSHKLTLLTHSSISFGVYNLTGKANVYSIYFVSEEDKIKGYQMSIFAQAIPFVTYNIKF